MNKIRMNGYKELKQVFDALKEKEESLQEDYAIRLRAVKERESQVEHLRAKFVTLNEALELKIKRCNESIAEADELRDEASLALKKAKADANNANNIRYEAKEQLASVNEMANTNKVEAEKLNKQLEDLQTRKYDLARRENLIEQDEKRLKFVEMRLKKAVINNKLESELGGYLK